jgi:RNA polymerase sigma factor for flagellar operon FliA
MEPQSAERLFLEHLSWINRVAQMNAVHYGLLREEAEDFMSMIRMKIMDDDYGIIRRHRGESTLKTYLATVVVRQLHDYLRERRGRWRPSPSATRLGPLAVHLEALVYRDGYTISQAITKLQTAGYDVPDERELFRLFRELPQREALRPKEVRVDPLLTDPENADTPFREAETERRLEERRKALERALSSLSAEDQVIVRLHFVEGLTLADVSRALNLEQKPLYRRVSRLRTSLLQRLTEEEIDPSDLSSDSDV